MKQDYASDTPQISVCTVCLRVVRDYSSYNTCDLYLVRVGLRCTRKLSDFLARRSMGGRQSDNRLSRSPLIDQFRHQGYDARSVKRTVQSSRRDLRIRLCRTRYADLDRRRCARSRDTAGHEVYRSLRFYDGVRITYRVTPDVIQSIKEIESHIGQGNQRLRPADEKVADKIDEDDRRYLSRCRDWIRLYASD